jgi:hypothetical protein
MCGALDCLRCFPQTYKENMLYDQYREEDTEKSFDEWMEEQVILQAECKSESYKDGEDDWK